MMEEPRARESGCLVCGGELLYQPDATECQCALCGRSLETTAHCARGHFVCDECHALPSLDLIERTCEESGLEDPLELARQLMRHPLLKMHGPEHHYLVPAVLISCASRVSGRTTELVTRLAEARRRAQTMPGGACGLQGVCGAAIGAGIFASVMTGASPLSTREWSDGIRVTARALSSIAAHGGPRCCKRCSTLAILVGIEFAAEILRLRLPIAKYQVCEFHERNRQCLHENCPFFPVELEARKTA